MTPRPHMAPTCRAKRETPPRSRRKLRLTLLFAALLTAAAIFPIVAQGVTAWQTGDVFAGVGNGQYQVYSNNGTFKETISQGMGGFTTGCSFNNAEDHLYTTNFSSNNIVRFQDPSPHLIDQVLPTPGVTLTPSPDANNESIAFMANGNYLVGHAGGGADVHQYTETGLLVAEYDVASELVGSDWIDLAANQTTLFYTSEGTRVLRFDIGTNTQMTDFNAAPLPGRGFALRILPPGDGSGGVLVAASQTIVRLDGSGNVVQQYDTGTEDGWFSLNLDPNGTSFWAGNFPPSNNFYRFNIASGAVEVGPINTGPGTQLFGLCLKGEPTAGGGDQCPPEDGDDGDDDGDGLDNGDENRLLTLLADSDSDNDSILDGNDDANGNGLDDEDEDDDDDDDDDECPDDDDDDDGVDDEDEDDDEDDD